MKISPKNIILSVLFLFIGGMIFGQNRQIRKGHRHFADQSYVLAIESYESGLGKAQDTLAMHRLAQSYWELRQVNQAGKWYRKAIKQNPENAPLLLELATVEHYQGQYENALIRVNEFFRLTGDSLRIADLKRSLEYALLNRGEENDYKIKLLPFNSQVSSDIGPYPTGKGIIFASNRRRGFLERTTDQRGGSLFYDLYEAKPGKKKGEWEVRHLEGEINSRFHEGPAVISPDGSKIYFTRSAMGRLQPEMDSAKFNRLKLCEAKAFGSKWENVVELPFNQEGVSSAHPAISKDGKSLIFSSDRPGGAGENDLWLVAKNDGEWGTPVPVSGEINSPGNEVFPWLAPDGSLYFASDHHPGFGGLDVFVCAPGEKFGTWEAPQNAGWGINSPGDDFGFVLVPGKPEGFVSSNRTGNDELYAFDMDLKVKLQFRDSLTNEPVSRGTVVLKRGRRRAPLRLTPDENGIVEFAAQWGKNYSLTYVGDPYYPRNFELKTQDANPTAPLEKIIFLDRGEIYRIFGTVRDKTNDQQLSGAEVVLSGPLGEVPLNLNDEAGFEKALDFAQDYTLVVTHEGYIPGVFTLNTRELGGPQMIEVPTRLQPGKSLLYQGRVIDLETGQPVPEVTVFAYNPETGAETGRTTTRDDGKYWLPVRDEGLTPRIVASGNGFLLTTLAKGGKPTGNQGGIVEIPNRGVTRQSVGALVKIIYFDFDKTEIKASFQAELDEIVDFMKVNPTVSLELAAHTDCRGDAQYNAQLSERRAKNAVNYIINQGISRSRISAKGYGETRPVNNCDCEAGFECPERMHQENRRLELRVTGFRE